MNIFVESISLDEIRQATAAGFADGIVITTVVDSSSTHGREIIEEIAQELGSDVDTVKKWVSPREEKRRDGKKTKRKGRRLN